MEEVSTLPLVETTDRKTSLSESDVRMTFDRQLDIFNPREHRDKCVVFIGVGTVGSWASLITAKLGISNIVLIDPDFVEIHNVANQVPGTAYIGSAKVEAMKTVLKSLCTVEPKVTQASFPMDADQLRDLAGVDFILVCGVDSMKVRAEIFEWLKVNRGLVSLYIDARTGGEVTRVFTVFPKDDSDLTDYAETLYSDDVSSIINETARALSEVKCTARSIADVSAYVGARITNCIRRHLTGRELKFEYCADISHDIWTAD